MRYFILNTCLFLPLALTVIGCSIEEGTREQEAPLLVVNQYFTHEFLNEWNNASIKDLEQQLLSSNKDTSEINFILENFRNDSLYTKGATRKKFIDLLRKKISLNDSIYSKSIFIVETEYLGEYIINRKNLIIDRESSDSFYRFKSSLGNWEVQSSGEAKELPVEKLDQLLTFQDSSGAEAQHVGSIIITKITSDRILSSVIVDPDEKQVELVSTFFERF